MSLSMKLGSSFLGIAGLILLSTSLHASSWEARCLDQALNYGKGKPAVEELSQCCARAFHGVQPGEKAMVKGSGFDAAAKWNLLCIRSHRDPSARPKVISGPESRLGQNPVVRFSAKSKSFGPLLFVLNQGAEGEEILGFNPKLDGNVAPARVIRLADIPKTVSYAVDPESGAIALLGSDGAIRIVSPEGDSRRANKNLHPVIQATITPPSPGIPVDIAYDAPTKRFFVLDQRGMVSFFSGSSSGKTEATELLRSDVSEPTSLNIEETEKALNLVVRGSTGEVQKLPFTRK